MRMIGCAFSEVFFKGVIWFIGLGIWLRGHGYRMTINTGRRLGTDTSSICGVVIQFSCPQQCQLTQPMRQFLLTYRNHF